jgi:peptide deformylase
MKDVQMIGTSGSPKYKLVAPEDIPLGEIVPLENKANLYNIFTDMIKMCEAEQGIGLSAVQVGLPYKMFVVKDGKKFRCFLNCDYEPTTEAKRTLSLEGCLSLRSPDGRLRFFEVERWEQIKVSGTEFCLSNFEFIFGFLMCVSSPLSIVFQHEIDHDKGLLISQIGKEVSLF